MSKHTPGTWNAWETPDSIWVVRAHYLNEKGLACTAYVAVCSSGGQDNEANALLMATSPKMLAALKGLGGCVCPMKTGHPQVSEHSAECQAVAEAIEEAEGEKA